MGQPRRGAADLTIRIAQPDTDGVGADPWLDPPLACDIVMKGGITSGVVYPGAVVRLARRYRFRSIGGASVGALAAAMAAAAEYGRASGGFQRLSTVPRELASTVGGDPFILTLFQPEPTTRRLFDTAIAFQRYGVVRGTLTAILRYWRFPLLAVALFAVALLGVALGLGGLAGWVISVTLLGLSPWVFLGGIVLDLLGDLKAVERNDFGLCRLGPESGESTALTMWMHGVIQDLAGRTSSHESPGDSPPVTFADLWRSQTGRSDESEEERRERMVRANWDTEAREIDLQVVTTNVTLGRPVGLPIFRDRWRERPDDGGLLFDPDEWRRFFPADVVDHMVSHATEPEGDVASVIERDDPGRKLLTFPGGAELPILVAARMSLSFPLLISAVPLWQVQFREDGNHRLKRLLVSDGGIASNFPVHLFDSPLPRRPTFAFNLAGFDPDETPDLDDPRDCVRDPASAMRSERQTWREPHTLLDFLAAVKDAAQNWRDNAQARMPGFRERVIHIVLAREEGGLNLAMDENKVSRLVARGDHAGGRLIELFSGPEAAPPQATSHWNDQRFARFRILMSAAERFLQGVRRGYTAPLDAATLPYSARIARGVEPPYALTNAQLDAAMERLAQYIALTDATETLDDDNIPRPRAIARIIPPL